MEKYELTLNGHTNHVMTIKHTLDGRIVSGSLDSTMRIWNLRSGMCENVIKDYTDSLYDIDVLPDGRVISGCFKGTLKIWNIQKINQSNSSNQSNSCECIFEEPRMLYFNVFPDGRIYTMNYFCVMNVWC